MSRRKRADRVGRNDACPCGSGRKFKRCHGSPSPQADFRSVIADAWRDARAGDECFHFDAPSTCEGQLIDAHSVQRAGGLSRIARNGKVYLFTPRDPFALERSGGRLIPNLVGYRQATTFRGFCGKHDNSLFAPIEDVPLEPTTEQLTLLAYRAFSYERSAKIGAIKAFKALKVPDSRRSLPSERHRQQQASDTIERSELGLSDLERDLPRFNQALRDADWSAMQHLVLRVDPLPPILLSGGTYPEADLDGQSLQELGSESALEAVYTSIVPNEDDSGTVSLSWFGDQTAPRRLAESIERVALPDAADGLLRFVFGSFENVAIAPRWWDELEAIHRGVISERFERTMQPIPAGELFVDDGVRFAPFGVTEIIRLPSS